MASLLGLFMDADFLGMRPAHAEFDGNIEKFLFTDVGRYKNPAQVRRDKLSSAISMWQDVASQVRCT